MYDRHNKFIKINSDRIEFFKILRPILGIINSTIKIQKTINPIVDNIHKINSLAIFILLSDFRLSATNNIQLHNNATRYQYYSEEPRYFEGFL